MARSAPANRWRQVELSAGRKTSLELMPSHSMWLLDNDGNPLAAAFGFKEDVSAYLDFLNKGLDNYRNK